MGLAADFVLIVVAGLVGGVLASLVRLPTLVGYVVAGVFVGPHTAGPTVVQIKDIETLAEIGVALLLFSIGLEVSFRDLVEVRRVAILGGALQVAITMTAGALGAHYGLAMPAVEAVWFGAMISVSSTMVVLKTLSARGVMSTLAGKVMIGILLVQDLAVIPMLVVLPQVNSSEGMVQRIAVSLSVSAGLVVLTFLVGTRLLPSVLRWILAWGSRELFLVAVVAVGVGVGAAMHAAGFSFALGAFIAGLILSESELSHQALSDVAPLRDIFGLLFFVTVGMLFDPRFALNNAGSIVTVVAAILTVKALITGSITRAFGYRNMAPWIVGLGLSQIGEFSFVLARAGLNSGLISKNSYDLVLTAAVLTVACSPPVSALALPLGRAWQRWTGSERKRGAAPAPEQLTMTGHVVVGGYGRTGRAIARALKEAGEPCLIVESDHTVAADLTADGLAGLWGDISREELLHAANIEQASVLLLTMPHLQTTKLALERSRRMNPQIVAVARAGRAHQVADLQFRGASVVLAEFEGGLEMVRQALIHCGHGAVSVDRIVTRIREETYGIERSFPAQGDAE